MNQPRGSGVIRHQPLHDGFVPAQGPQHGFAEAIDRHIAEHFGPVEFMYHEIASNLVGVHVRVVAPSEGRVPFERFLAGQTRQ